LWWRRGRVATGICIVSQRDPIQTAKSVATVDHLSRGRFLFGTGVGWNRDEIKNHSNSFKPRLSLIKERIEAMKAIWMKNKAEYHGQHVDCNPMMAGPTCPLPVAWWRTVSTSGPATDTPVPRALLLRFSRKQRTWCCRSSTHSRKASCGLHRVSND